MPYYYRHTIIFDGPGHGATESLIFQTPNTDLVAAQSIATGVLYKRSLLLGSQWQIKGQRVGLVAGPAVDTRIKRRSEVDRVYYPGVSSQPAEPTGVSLQVAMFDSSRSYAKRTYMCGPWASLFPGANVFTPAGAPGWTSYFQQWSSYLVANNFGWFSNAVNEPDEYEITGYTFDAVTGYTTFTTEDVIDWPDVSGPVKVSIEFPLSRSPLDGVQLVIPLGPTSFKTASPRPARPFTVEGTLKIADIGFVNLTTPNTLGLPGSINGEVPMSRKRGRPLLVARGRQPVQVRW